ncbi:hypothetical protein [Streptomyces sp. NBC_01233]|uniref:hypothetical protein n=1 Tax=Streptomyces sp. NBC_01233 TaxID=2903787 RepID=UPI002E1459B8|nr:hypothetical protein OG332_45855 [Streptomyces sp. NBC_01233]
MRTISLPKPLMAAVLGALALSACGVPNADADRSPAGEALPAAASQASGADAAEIRFLEMTTGFLAECSPGAPADKGGADVPRPEAAWGGAPRPEDLPGGSGPVTPRYGPGQTPPGIPDADGSIPVPLDDPAPPLPAATPTHPGTVAEAPLTEAERCVADRHTRRITEALRKAAPADHGALRTALAGLDYPAARIHRIPDGDSTRVDLRFMGGVAVLEITGTGPTPTVTLKTEDAAVTAAARTP